MPRQKKKSTLFKWIIYVCIALLIVALSYIGYLAVNAYQTLNQIQDVEHRSDNEDEFVEEYEEVEQKEEIKKMVRGGNTVSIMIAGVDTEHGRMVGRSDVLMVAAIDMDSKESTLLSIPRDTYVQIAGTDEYDKINHAYAKSANISLRTVENYLNIPIDYYIAVNFTAFERFVDVIGGLQLNVERTIHNSRRADDIYLNPGQQWVNGAQALDYVRFRADSEGDFGRNRRQQQVMKEILNQSTNIRSVIKIPEVLNIIGNNVRTNMETNKMISFITNLSSLTGDNVETLRLTGSGMTINTISYVDVAEEDRLEVEKALQDRMQIDFVSVLQEKDES